MKLLDKLKELLYEVRRVKFDNKETRLLVGSLLAQNARKSTSIRDAEFKVFSQFGDDGIIQFLLSKIPTIVDKFVEFGVENYEESNTRFLLMNNNWCGLIIDGSDSNITYIKQDSMYWRYDLNAIKSFITIENINQTLEDNNFNGRIGILSIDIDGNDYWIWKAITVTEADVVIIEYNSLFGINRPITVPYRADFVRNTIHYSNLYFGASLLALCELGETKGYSFIGCNSAGNNAYFVKKHLMNNLTEILPKDGYVKARFREGRDQNGNLTLANEQKRKSEIINLSVINTRTEDFEKI